MSGRARALEAARAARRGVALLGFVGALLIGVRFDRGIRVAWTVSVARADDAASGNVDPSVRERARELLIQGVDLLKRAEYQAALERFDTAYELVPSPNIHYDRALAYLGLQRQAAALEEFEAFLDDATHPPPGKREQAQSHQADLRTRVARLDASAVPSGAEIIVDGNRRGTTPLERWIYLEPGPHEISIRVSAAAGEIREPVNARAGQPVELTMNLHPDPPPIALAATPAVAMPPAPPAASEPRFQSTGARSVAIGVMAGGVVLLGAGLTFGILAQREGDSLTSDSRSVTSTHSVTADLNKQSRGKADQQLETIFIGTGAAAITSGVVLYVLNRHRAAESRAGYALIGAPLFGQGLAGARLRMQF